jgi:hypothetical protein
MAPDDEPPPPLFGSWRVAYAVVLGWLAVQVLLFTLVSRAF